MTGWKAATPTTGDWLRANSFTGGAGKAILLPSSPPASAVAVIEPAQAIWNAAAISKALPAGSWSVHDDSDPALDPAQVCLGWALAQYAFTSYRDAAASSLRILDHVTACPDAAACDRVIGLATGTALCRDLINAPPNHMTPQGLEDAARDLAGRFGASCEVTAGAALEDGFPAIDTVGRAAEVAPRLIDMRWGNAGPSITLIGKGITFDSGGLDLKPSKAMELMKKDMGGAATVLGLAAAVMTAALPVRLRVLVPTAENAVSAKSMRPLDVIDTRAGMPVEVGNTDAEGRLVLADAITLACEEEPDFMIDFATLTGAARWRLAPSCRRCSAIMMKPPTASWRRRQRRTTRCGGCRFSSLMNGILMPAMSRCPAPVLPDMAAPSRRRCSCAVLPARQPTGRIST